MASIAEQTATAGQSLVYKSLGSTPCSTLASSPSTSPTTSSTSTYLSLETMDFTQVVQNCNKFRFKEKQASLFRFFVLDNEKHVGYMLPSFITQMTWHVPGFQVDQEKKTVLLNPDTKPGETMQQACENAFVALCRANADKVKGLGIWVRQYDSNSCPEYHPILGLGPDLAWLKMPSPIRGVFGIVTSGAHMTMYTFKGGNSIPHIWVAKRSPHVTYSGKYDQLAAGAVAPGDDNIPLKAMAREAMEEAGLTVDLETSDVTTEQGERVGSLFAGRLISFYDEKSEIAGSESGHVEPGIRYTFELAVPEWFVPEPCEPHAIESFRLLSVDEVKESLKAGEWKPNSALVMLSFFETKGLLGIEEKLELDVLNSVLEY